MSEIKIEQEKRVMIRDTPILTEPDVTNKVPLGWITDYVDVAKRTPYPLAYHVINGLYAFSSILGRRARIDRIGYTLYPPVWCFLIGHSGVGKSKSMNIARDTTEAANKLLSGELTFGTLASFTGAGIFRQVRENLDGISALEGGITIDEGAGVFGAAAGTDGNSQFLFAASEFKNVEDWTATYGKRTVPKWTTGFNLATTLDRLVMNMSAEEFGTGLLHRFFFIHSTDAPIDAVTHARKRAIEPYELEDLASAAKDIRQTWDFEEPIQFTKDANWLLEEIRKRKGPGTHIESAKMLGFISRFEGFVAKVAALYAAARPARIVTADDVEYAERLIDAIKVPIIDIIDDMSLPEKKRKLICQSYDLFYARQGGIPQSRFLRRLPGNSVRDMQNALDTLVSLGYVRTGTHQSIPYVWHADYWPFAIKDTDQQEEP